MELLIIQKRIFEIRGERVMFDFDLAELYRVETKVLKQAVKRNIDLFPEDFMFVLTRIEYNFLRSQFVTLEKGKGKHSKYLPFAFTEHGVAMLANVLRSKKARQISISIVRAFIALKKFANHNKQLEKKISMLERKYNRKFKDVYEAIHYLLQKEKTVVEYQKRRRIGFKN